MENVKTGNSRFPGYRVEVIEETYKCLARLPHWKRRAFLIHADIDDLTALIREAAAPRVQNLGNVGHGSGGGSSEEERAVERLERWEMEIQEKQAMLDELEPKIKSVERAIDSLPGDEKRILKGKYLDGLTWQGVALNVGASVGYCRRYCDKAIGSLAIALYGPGACPGLFGLPD